MRLLLIEDDPALAAGLALSFRHSGWEVDIAPEGNQAFRCFEARAYAVVLIDWNLPPPGPSGLELCVRMRELSPSIGLIFATGREALGDRLLAFKAGADDYLVKPFDCAELVARVEAVARRSSGPSGPVEVPPQQPAFVPLDPVAYERHLVCESIKVDLATLRVTVEDHEVELSLRQLLLLIYLMQHRGRLVPESDLREHVLRTGSHTRTSTIRNHIHQLRARLGSARRLIHCEHGEGYGVGLTPSRGTSGPHPDRPEPPKSR